MNTHATRSQIIDFMARQTGDEKHDASATSVLDVLSALYGDVLDVSPDALDAPDRDRFYLSKGHGPMAYFAVLAAYGFFDPDVLPTFRDYDSPLGLHPDRLRVPGVEISSGSLGHGLALAVGTALAVRLHRNTGRVIALLGDAEFDEGSNAEAIAVAGRFGLDGLTAVVVDNRSASLGWPGGIGARFAVEGWGTTTVEGGDRDALVTALRHRDPRRPHAVVVRVADKAA
jgi:transketolase